MVHTEVSQGPDTHVHFVCTIQNTACGEFLDSFFRTRGLSDCFRASRRQLPRLRAISLTLWNRTGCNDEVVQLENLYTDTHHMKPLLALNGFQIIKFRSKTLSKSRVLQAPLVAMFMVCRLQNVKMRNSVSEYVITLHNKGALTMNHEAGIRARVETDHEYRIKKRSYRNAGLLRSIVHRVAL